MNVEHTTTPALVTRTQGTGKDLVLLHGWGVNSGVFASLLPHLSQEYRVTLVDLPGFGQNHQYQPAHYTVAGLAEAVAPALPETCIVGGWSLGGLVAQQLALTQPQQVSGLVTLASSPRFIAGPGWPGIAPQVLADFGQSLQASVAKTLDRFLAIQAMGSPSARQDIRHIKQQVATYPDPAPDAVAAALALLGKEDLRAQLPQIRQPTLRIFGRLDTLVPAAAIDLICQLHPQADTVVLPSASHAPFISHPQQTADILLRYQPFLCG